MLNCNLFQFEKIESLICLLDSFSTRLLNSTSVALCLEHRRYLWYVYWAEMNILSFLTVFHSFLEKIQEIIWQSSVSVQSLSHVRFFVTPWTAARQASLSLTISQSLLKPMSIKSVMPSNHLILCHPLLLLLSIFPSIRVFSNESVLRISHQLIAKIKENPQVSTKIRGKSIVLGYKNYAFLVSFFAIWLENKIICFYFLIYNVTKKMIKFLPPRNQKMTELYLDILSHY